MDEDVTGTFPKIFIPWDILWCRIVLLCSQHTLGGSRDVPIIQKGKLRHKANPSMLLKQMSSRAGVKTSEFLLNFPPMILVAVSKPLSPCLLVRRMIQVSPAGSFPCFIRTRDAV